MQHLLGLIKAAGLLAALSLVSSPGFAQESKAIRFTDNVYLVSVMGNSSLVVIGDKGVLITDSSSPPRARLLKAEIAKLTDKPVTKIVLSHEHTDHVGGTRVFENAQIIAHSNVKSVFMLDQTGQVPKKVDVYFDQEHVVDMGPTRVELKHLGWTEGHANIVVYLPKESIVLLSDLYEGRKALLNPNMLEATNMVGVHKVLQEVSKWQPKYSLSSHSTITDPARMYEYAKFFNDLYNAVHARLQTHFGDSPKMWEAVEAVPKQVTLPAYKDWEDYDEFLPGYVYRMAYSLAYGG